MKKGKVSLDVMVIGIIAIIVLVAVIAGVINKISEPGAVLVKEAELANETGDFDLGQKKESLSQTPIVIKRRIAGIGVLINQKKYSEAEDELKEILEMFKSKKNLADDYKQSYVGIHFYLSDLLKIQEKYSESLNANYEAYKLSVKYGFKRTEIKKGVLRSDIEKSELRNLVEINLVQNIKELLIKGKINFNEVNSIIPESTGHLAGLKEISKYYAVVDVLKSKNIVDYDRLYILEDLSKKYPNDKNLVSTLSYNKEVVASISGTIKDFEPKQREEGVDYLEKYKDFMFK